jgi:hypothetical protein
LLFELEVRKLNFSKRQSTGDQGSSIINRSVEAFMQNCNNPTTTTTTTTTDTNSAHWAQFKLARMCVRYTFYSLAEAIYARLAERVANSMTFNMSTSDLSYKGWLDFMGMLCRAESRVNPARAKTVHELVQGLSESLSFYTRAMSMFKATCTRSLTQACSNTPALENSNACFQIRYGELRSEQIKMFIHLVMSVMTCLSVPPPRFQFKTTATDKFSRHGRVAQQMKYSVNELHKLNLKYKELLSECFDADQHTINILNM